MKRLTRLILFSFFGLFFIIQGSGCATTGGGGDVTIFLPSWIHASWFGGQMGGTPPGDRRDEAATEWIGDICATNTIDLINHGVDFGIQLQVINNCPGQTVSMLLCLAKGSLPQPPNGIKECATDPFDTPLTQLTPLTLNQGSFGFTWETTADLAVNVFFCSQSQTLAGPPFTDSLQCI